LLVHSGKISQSLVENVIAYLNKGYFFCMFNIVFFFLTHQKPSFNCKKIVKNNNNK